MAPLAADTATSPGKRKARAAAAVPDDAQAILRRHFEAQFAPLKPVSTVRKPAVVDVDEASLDADSQSDESGSEWSGISDEGEQDVVEMVDHSSLAAASPDVSMTKRELRDYMSSRPPPPTTAKLGSAAAAVDALPPLPSAEDTSAPALLANDLALQRLLSESHLFSAHSSAADARLPMSLARGRDRPFGAGRARHYATELRLQSLGSGGGGSSGPLVHQKNMPMAQRRGIAAAAAGRETRRRQEAREAGVILEKEQQPKSRKKPARAGRALDAPSVGRLRGAELRLSKRDVREIEGPRKAAGKKKRRRR